MMRRPVSLLLAAGALLAGGVVFLPSPATGAPPGRADHVLIVGIAGLRWDDVNQQDTPTLWRLAGQGAVGSLAVRGATTVTCPIDGWVTLGAGNRARYDRTRTGQECQDRTATVSAGPRGTATLPDQPEIRGVNSLMSYGARPGALAESVRCVAAIGPAAALAAAGPVGRIGRYAQAPGPDLGDLLVGCPVATVDLGTVSDPDRRSAARAADAGLAAVQAARPVGSVLMVLGLSDTGRPARLHVAVADGPGFRGGWLTSASTGRGGFVQLIDAAPTALAALDVHQPASFLGQPMSSTGSGRPDSVATTVDELTDAEREAVGQRAVVGRFAQILVLGQLLLYLVATVVLAWARYARGPLSLIRGASARRTGPASSRAGARIQGRARGVRSGKTGWLIAWTETAACAAALALPAVLLASAAPWWRSDHPGRMLATITIVLAVLATVLVSLVARHVRPLGPLVAVAGLAALVVGVDVVTGGHLQLGSVVGYSAVEGGRYTGLGTLAFGIFAAGTLLVAGWLAQRAPRRYRPAVMAAVGAVGVLVAGSPYLGADAGGAVALTAGVCVASVISSGGWLTLSRLIWATLAGMVVTAGFAGLDLSRPASERGHLGRFLSQLANGTAGPVLHRSIESNMSVFLSSPLTILAIVAAAFVGFVLLRPVGGLKRVFGLYPAIRAALIGTAVAGLVGGLVDGAGVTVAAASAATAVPLAVLATLRVLARSDDHPAPRTPTPPTIGTDRAAKPADAEPVAATPAGAEPVAATPADAEPVDIRPADAEPVVELVATEPVATEPVATGPVATGPVSTEPVSTEPAGPDAGDPRDIAHFGLARMVATRPTGVALGRPTNGAGSD